MIGTFPLSALVPSNFIKTASILILECAAIRYASSSRPSPRCEEVLDEACSQFISSNTHNVVHQEFVLSPKSYSALQFTEFVLTHRLR